MKLFAVIFLALGVLASRVEGGDVSAQPRSAHWVIRSTDLKASIKFFETVFGMRIIRHEENDEPCPITCNGLFPTPWSKTMMGYETEDEAYCFEITYNYGVNKYFTGQSLQHFAIAVEDPQATLEAARGAGYTVVEVGGKELIVGPEQYRFEVVGKTPERKEPFQFVQVGYAKIEEAARFYAEVLRMDFRQEVDGGVLVGYAGEDQVPMKLVSKGSGKVPIQQWEGRHAISMPAAQLKAVYEEIRASTPELIVHELMELDEKLGKLYIAIIKDPEGYEICLVSSETFDKAVREAADFKGPDWNLRATLRKEYAKRSRGKAKALPDTYTPSDYVKHVMKKISMGTATETEVHFVWFGALVGFMSTTIMFRFL